MHSNLATLIFLHLSYFPNIVLKVGNTVAFYHGDKVFCAFYFVCFVLCDVVVKYRVSSSFLKFYQGIPQLSW
ncbi:unnamed protein product [Parnassius mnemosyne]|uniref:Uncharacterized protein n=1 Tax=Parnassius mnemosyne TaxID=213953 RepID=A0AAV1M590_9NEOP